LAKHVIKKPKSDPIFSEETACYAARKLTGGNAVDALKSKFSKQNYNITVAEFLSHNVS
jgi:hypothetical protein